MKAEYKIKISNIEKAKQFVSLASSTHGDISLVSGRFCVDAKSILGVFSLDLSKAITCAISSKSELVVEEFEKDLIDLEVIQPCSEVF